MRFTIDIKYTLGTQEHTDIIEVGRVLEGRKANHNNFSSEPPRNPRPFNIIFLSV